MQTPEYLKAGSKIRIVSPAGKTKEERILPAVDWLEKKGFQVELGQHVFSNHFQYAGTDKQRQDDLQQAIDDPETSAIICARGGYGTVRLINKLDFTAFKRNPKWIVGYSDITALHLAVNNLDIATIHGSMPPFFFEKNGEANQNLLSLIQLISGKETSYSYSSGKCREGMAKGELIGGNLSIITSLLSTGCDIRTDGKILFIEDIDEYLYHIDRMMHQLVLSGKLANLAGLVVGDFTEVKDNEEPFGQSFEEIILHAVKDYNYPVSFGLRAGHGDINFALAFGREWELNVTKKESLFKHKS